MDMAGVPFIFKGFYFCESVGKKHWSFRGFSPALILFFEVTALLKKISYDGDDVVTFDEYLGGPFFCRVSQGRPSNFWVSKNPLNPKRTYVRCRNPS